MKTHSASDLPIGTKSAIVRLALSGIAPARIAMKGESMLPALREGMVLDLQPAGTSLRVGQIAVFQSGERLVAHRVIRKNGDLLVCAGDAQPDCLEQVHLSDLIGIVQAVWSPNGERVDGAWFRFQGMLLARLQRLRSFVSRALPMSRPRTYSELIEIMSAVVCADESRLRAAVSAAPPWRVAVYAQRHRCAGALCAALEKITGSDYAAALQKRLREQRWSAYLRAPRMRAQLVHVLSVLRSAGIDPVLLKGAERIATRTKEGELFESSDLDLLVPPHQVQAACDTLRAAGYQQRCEPSLLAYYRDAHHHAAPLQPDGEGLPIEIHRALAPQPLNLPKEWNELAGYVSTVQLLDGYAKVLDPVGGALHLAMHAGVQRPALREIVLLALRLRALDDYERKRLHGLLRRERRFRIEINAPVAFAAQLAGIQWPAQGGVDRFVRWMIVREDLPRPLRARTDCVDAYFAAERSAIFCAMGAAWPEGGRSIVSKIRCAAARIVAGAAIALYVRFMR